MLRIAPRRAGPSPTGRAAFVALTVVLLVSACGGTAGSSQSASGSPGPQHQPPEPGVCKGCTPPLVYSGGPVLGASGLTITPIYWSPSGYDMPQTYVAGVNQYLSDIATASGATDNTYAIGTEYGQQGNGGNATIQYKITAGSPITDTNAFPSTDSACTFADPNTACVTKTQMITEVMAQSGITPDFSHLYLLFLPPNVASSDGQSTAGFCGYHDGFVTSNGDTLLWADEPFPTADCFGGQSPSGVPAVDSEISTLSHEIIEAETDPLVGSKPAWADSTGNEIGDECSWDFGAPLGSTDPNNASSTMYNQVINGHQYYTQQIFSNAAFQAKGQGHGCILGSNASAAVAPTAQTTAQLTADTLAGSALVDASTTKVAADGAATAAVTDSVVDANGEPVANAHVHFNVAPVDETKGVCGAVHPSDTSTDANGEATTTYTASKANAACIVIAIDNKTGASDWATIYQGSAADAEPAITDASVPTSLAPGANDTFTITAKNPSSEDIKDARFDVFLSGDGNASSGLSASQVHITYAISGGGASTPLALDGDTSSDGMIEGDATPDTAQDIAAGATVTVTFQIAIDAGAPTSSSTGAPMHLEVDLDQYNPADDSTDNLDYIGPTDITIG